MVLANPVFWLKFSKWKKQVSNFWQPSREAFALPGANQFGDGVDQQLRFFDWEIRFVIHNEMAAQTFFLLGKIQCKKPPAWKKSEPQSASLHRHGDGHRRHGFWNHPLYSLEPAGLQAALWGSSKKRKPRKRPQSPLRYGLGVISIPAF